MIKVNELRIGNYFKPIKESKDEFVEAVEIHSSGHVYCEDSAGVIFNSNEFEPIKLTEEWLLKFGFYKRYTTGNYSIVINGYSYGINTSGNVDLDYEEYENICEIKYVHQLQNFYSALTGEELTLKTDNNETNN